MGKGSGRKTPPTEAEKAAARVKAEATRKANKALRDAIRADRANGGAL